MEYSPLKKYDFPSKQNIVKNIQINKLNISNPFEKSNKLKENFSQRNNLSNHSMNILDISHKNNFNGSFANYSRNYESYVDISLLSTSKSNHRSKSDILNSFNKLKSNNNIFINKKNSMPIITEKTQKNKKNAKLFPQKLYHLNNLNIKEKISEHSLSEVNEKDFNINNKQKVANCEFYSFHPVLSPNSIRIADKLGNSFIRLTKIPKRKLYEKNQTKIFEIELIQNKYSDLKNNNLITSKNTKSSDNIKYQNSNQSNYKRRIKKINESELKIKELLNDKDNLFKSFSFSPNILQRKNNSINKEKNQKNQFNNFYLKNIKWKEKIRNKSAILLRENNLEELSECTFHPKIYKNKINNDTSFILKNIEQIIKYVKKRKEFLTKKKMDEIEKEKRFFNINYLNTHVPITNINKLKNLKTVIVKDYDFKNKG